MQNLLEQKLLKQISTENKVSIDTSTSKNEEKKPNYENECENNEKKEKNSKDEKMPVRRTKRSKTTYNKVNLLIIFIKHV